MTAAGPRTHLGTRTAQRVLLIRHGQSAWQVGESMSLDAPLTELGRSQASAVGRHLAAALGPQMRQARLATSGLERAAATARLIAALAAPDATVQVDGELAEAPFRLADEDDSQPGAQPSERYRAFYERALSCWAGLVDHGSGNRDHPCTVIITHNGFIKCVVRSLMDRPGMTLKVANGSITEIVVEEGVPKVVALGATDHLPAAMVTF